MELELTRVPRFSDAAGSEIHGNLGPTRRLHPRQGHDGPSFRFGRGPQLVDLLAQLYLRPLEEVAVQPERHGRIAVSHPPCKERGSGAVQAPVGAANLSRPCEQDEWIEAMEWVNSILAMSGDVVAAQTHDPTLGRTR